MFGDYTRSTPNKIVFTPGSDYVLEARNTATGGIVTSTYSASRQWGTKPKGGIYDPYAANLVLAIPGGAVGGATSTFDVTGQIRFETPTASYVNAGIVTYSNSYGTGTYTNKSITNTGVTFVSMGSAGKWYGNTADFTGGSTKALTFSPGSDFVVGTGDFTIEFWGRVSTVDTGYNNYVFDASGGSRFGLLRYGSGPDGNYSLILTDSNIFTVIPATYPINQWHHIAVCRKNGVVYGFLNGVMQTSTTATTNISSQQTTIAIGNYPPTPAGQYNYDGYLQDFRFYKGVAKYTSNFTPPNQIYLT